jgi:THUMP domain-like/RNA cap guanine-N2 methyltransferase
MDLATFRRLLEPHGQAALAAADELRPTAATLLAAHQRLRKQFPDELVKAALETALLRLKAAGKFSRADRMYFTREALEQSSGEVIATYRAGRFGGAGRVGDFCCGIGGDLIGLAAVAAVVAVDADPLRLAMAEENLKACGREDQATFVQGDVLTVPLPDLGAAFFDPDRRADGRRHLRIREYAPSLDAVRARLPAGFPLGVKVAPGVPWDDLRGYDAEAEFISVAGELKECVLWFGPLKTTGRRATVLPQKASLFADQPADAAEPGPPLAYLYDPDPAVVRSGLVADLGQQLEARPVDAEIAYLTADRYTATPFARCYAVEATMPFHARQLGERLRSMNVGPVTITKRGSAVDVDELRRKWRLTGSEARTVVLMRVLGRPFALIARPVQDGTG